MEPNDAVDEGLVEKMALDLWSRSEAQEVTNFRIGWRRRRE